MNAKPHRVEVFLAGYPLAELTGKQSRWGWECYDCHDEQTGIGTLAEAEAAADRHCWAPVEVEESGGAA